MAAACSLALSTSATATRGQQRSSESLPRLLVTMTTRPTGIRRRFDAMTTNRERSRWKLGDNSCNNNKFRRPASLLQLASTLIALEVFLRSLSPCLSLSFMGYEDDHLCYIGEVNATAAASASYGIDDGGGTASAAASPNSFSRVSGCFERGNSSYVNMTWEDSIGNKISLDLDAFSDEPLFMVYTCSNHTFGVDVRANLSDFASSNLSSIVSGEAELEYRYFLCDALAVGACAAAVEQKVLLGPGNDEDNNTETVSHEVDAKSMNFEYDNITKVVRAVGKVTVTIPCADLSGAFFVIGHVRISFPTNRGTFIVLSVFSPVSDEAIVVRKPPVILT